MADLIVLLARARRRGWWMAVGFLFAAVSVAAGVVLTTAAGWYVAALGSGGALLAVGVSGGLLRGAAITRTVSRYLERIVTHEATFRVLADIRVWFFERAIPLAPLRLGGLRGGDLLSRAIADIEALDGLYLRMAVPIGVAMLVAAGGVTFLATVSPAIAGTALLGAGLAGVVLPALVRRRSDAPGRAMVEAGAALRTGTVDLVQGLPELIVYGAAGRQLDGIAAADRRLVTAQRRQSRIAAASEAASALLTNLAIAAALLVGAAAGETGPSLAPAVFCVMAMFEAIGPLPAALQQLGRGRAAARRLLEVAQTAPAVVEPARPREPTGNDLRFAGVGFTYPGASRPALDAFDLAVGAGETVAIVGASGAGKSTVLLLAQRFADPDRGTVSLGGVAMTEMRSDRVRDRVGLLSQRARIFAGSLRENLLLGRPDAGDGEIHRALAAAGLGPFLDGLPDGLDTWLGENGVAVSGGEARRIALARTCLRDTPVVLLDEPTEGLDPETERDVLGRLAAALRGKTVVLVSHREAALALADRVVRLERGRVVSG